MNKNLIKLCLGLALLFVLVAHAGKAASITDRLVLANKMLCLPPLGVNPNPGGYYWYTVTCRPWNTDHPNGYSNRPSAWCTNPKAADIAVQGYVDEINEAKAYGIDGFICDITSVTSGDIANWTAMVKAAGQVGDFWVCIQPDLTTGMTPQTVKPLMDATASLPGYLKLDGRPLIVPYCAGYGTPASEKAAWVDWYGAQGMPIAYIPSVFLNASGCGPYLTNNLSFKDPKSGYPAFAAATTTFAPYDDDRSRQRALDYWKGSGLPFISDVTFQYQNIQVAYVQNHGSQYFRNTFQWCVDNRNNGVQWVQPNNWNDFGESAFAPSENIFMALAPISKYYADWFKTGTAPAIAKDSVSIFHHAYAHTAKPSVYPYFGISGPDEVEAVALLKAPAMLVVKTGSRAYSINVDAGIQSLTEPASLGIQSASVVRNGSVTATVTSPIPFCDDPIRSNVWTVGYGSAYPPENIPLTNWSTLSGSMAARGATANGTGVALVGNANTMIDYRIYAMVTPSSASDGSSAGLIVYAQGESYFRFAIGQWNGKSEWRLSRIDNGADTVLLSADTECIAGRARAMRLDKIGDYLVCYLDGVQIAHTADWGTPNAPFTDGRFGFGQAGVYAAGAAASFSGISVQRYQPNMSNIVATPTFSPPPGAYSKPQRVSLSCSTDGATVRFTTDGSTPSSVSGTVYTRPVELSGSETLRAMAYKSGMLDSYLRTGAYISGGSGRVALPTFSLSAGTYRGAQKVTISCSTAGATIRFTTDGSDPTVLRGEGGPTAIIGSTCTIKAIATCTYLTDSGVASASYTIKPSTGWVQIGATDTKTYSTPSAIISKPTFSTLGSIPPLLVTTDGAIPNMKVSYQLTLPGLPGWGPQCSGREGLMLYSGDSPDVNSGLFTGVDNWVYNFYGALASDTGAPEQPIGYPYVFANPGVQESFDVVVEVYNGIMTTTVSTTNPPGKPVSVRVYAPTAADMRKWAGKMGFGAFRAGPCSNYDYSVASVTNITFYKQDFVANRSSP